MCAELHYIARYQKTHFAVTFVMYMSGLSRAESELYHVIWFRHIFLKFGLPHGILRRSVGDSKKNFDIVPARALDLVTQHRHVQKRHLPSVLWFIRHAFILVQVPGHFIVSMPSYVSLLDCCCRLNKPTNRIYCSLKSHLS